MFKALGTTAWHTCCVNQPAYKAYCNNNNKKKLYLFTCIMYKRIMCLGREVFAMCVTDII